MPFTMIHLHVAMRAAGSKTEKKEEFLLGSIAPDAVHYLPDYTSSYKCRSHLLPDGIPWGTCEGRNNELWEENIRKFVIQWAGVVEKDFIFSAVSEEMGAIFAICVLLICLGCFIQFMMIAARMQAVFYKLIAFGLGVEYIVQVFLTVGGVTKFIPSTGVTLPFVSYGGSSILGTFLLFGIIQGLYILKRNDEEETAEEVMP